MSQFPANLKANPLLSRWVELTADGRVRIRSGKVELGQGIATAMAMIAATELGVELDAIDVVPADTASAPDEGYTAGSFSIEHGGAAMRWAAAQVRDLCVEAAARQFECQPEDLVVADGYLRHPQSNQALRYHQLRDVVSLDVSALDLPAPRLRGGTMDHQAIKRIDLQQKISTSAFIQDLRLPGQYYGRVLRASHPKQRLLDFDRVRVQAMPGVVHVVQDGSFAGVVAKSDDATMAALLVMQKTAHWSEPEPLPDDDGLNGWMDAVTPHSTCFIDEPFAQDSDLQHVKARYSRPYLAHASIGPSTAVAQWHHGQLHVYSHSQGIYPLQRQLARVFGLTAEQVVVYHRHGSGCYGHNGADDVALDAALLARSVDGPVMVMWSRADELSWSPFGAAMRIDLAADLDSQGQIRNWSHDVYSPPHLARPGFGDGVALLAASHLAEPHPLPPLADAPRPQGGGDRNAVPLYEFEARRITHHLLPQGPLRSSAMRALGAHANVFAIECFLDELALASDQDPVAFRLRHLSDDRGRQVIETAAKMSGWHKRMAGGDGQGLGLGFARYKNLGAWCAVVVDLDITERLVMKRVYVAVDAGEVIHRDGVINQIEGGVIQAASWTLKEAAGFSQAGFAARSWADYPILTFSETPDIVVELVAPAGAPALGVGECVAGPMAAALGNAIAHALGVRVRDMPLTVERITQSLHHAE